jgi:hypothetical protein
LGGISDSTALCHTNYLLGCSNQRDAEFRHPVLGVPLCGWCYKAFRDKELFNTDTLMHAVHNHADPQNGQAVIMTTPTKLGGTRDDEDSICLWCGSDDDRELYMCDSADCKNSICRLCVVRNFGIHEADRVKAMDIWYCYACSPTASFKDLLVAEKDLIFSLEKVFSSMDSTSQMQSIDEQKSRIAGALTPAEIRFISLFADELPDVDSIPKHALPCVGAIQAQIIDYLAAADVFAGICLVSKNVKSYFQMASVFHPGLFQQPNLEGKSYRLYQHQRDSLSQLIRMENRTTKFGELRGGILADAPGLGKSVTMLALICSTCSTLPVLPPSLAMARSMASGPDGKENVEGIPGDQMKEWKQNWQAELANPVQRQYLTATVNALRKQVTDPAAQMRIKSIIHRIEALSQQLQQVNSKQSGLIERRDPMFESVETFESHGKHLFVCVQEDSYEDHGFCDISSPSD